MTEYIKREYAVDAVADVYYNTPDINLSCEKFEAAILKIQAADVAPVMHGRWISKNHHGYEWVFVCSNCDYVDGYPFNDRPNYCPNCGAKMDEPMEESKR